MLIVGFAGISCMMIQYQNVTMAECSLLVVVGTHAWMSKGQKCHHTKMLVVNGGRDLRHYKKCKQNLCVLKPKFHSNIALNTCTLISRFNTFTTRKLLLYDN